MGVYITMMANTNDQPNCDKRFKMFFFEECHQMRKEIVARNVQTNVELEHLQKSGSQNLTAAKLNEAIRMQQKMISEILSLEVKIDNLKIDIHNEKAKSKRIEEDKLQKNFIILEVEDKLKKTESDKQLFQEQIHKSNVHIASIEYELQKSKAEMILLRIELKKLREACDILKKDNEASRNTPIIADQLLDEQENNTDLFPLQTDKGGLSEKEISLNLSEEEQLELWKHQTVEDDRILKLCEELESEKQQRHELEETLRTITAQLRAPNCKLQHRIIPLIITQVLIKSKVSTNLATEGLLAKFRSTNVQELKGKEAVVIKKLNQPQGLSLSSRQSSISEIPDDDIVIAPYCHQEENGITMWFWCQSTNGARNLKQIYKSDILLDILITIFKDFSNESVSSASTVTVLVPTSIAVFMCEFTEDGKKYDTDPVLIAKTRIKAADHGKKSINGLTILDTKLFVVTEQSSGVEIYDSIKLNFNRQWKLRGLRNPLDIGSCNRNKCLYILDFKATSHSKEILRVDTNGKLINKWSTDFGFSLSVTDESNVIVAHCTENKIIEYSPDGKLIRAINLSDADISSPMHVIKLTDDNFLVCHGTSDLHRICKVDANGKLVKSIRGKRGLSSAELKRPVHMAVDSNGFVIVTQPLSGQVLLLDSDLKFIGEILKKETLELQSPAALFLDESHGRMLVADNHDGRILNFQFSF